MFIHRDFKAHFSLWSLEILRKKRFIREIKSILRGNGTILVQNFQNYQKIMDFL